MSTNESNNANEGQSRAGEAEADLTVGLELRIARALAYQYFLGMVDAKGASEETANEFATKKSANCSGWIKEAKALLCPY